MSDHSRSPRSHPPDICLLLRVHGEQRWLATELLPILQELEQLDAVPEEQLPAALAYLELLWMDARRRAADTDAACSLLERPCQDRDPLLCEKARRYCAAVHRLRAELGARVEHLIRTPDQSAWQESADLADF